MAKKKDKTGPKEERLVFGDDWEDAVEKAIKKKKPKDGWPKDKKNKK